MYKFFRKQLFILTFIAASLSSYSVLMAESVRLEQVQKVTNKFLKTLNAASHKQTRLFSTKAKRSTESEELTSTGFLEIRDEDGAVLAYITELEPRLLYFID